MKWFLNTKEKKLSKIIKTTTTITKLDLKCSPISESNTFIAETNPEQRNAMKDYFSFFLLKILDNNVRSDDTIRSIIAFAIRQQQNSVGNINLTSVLKAAATDMKHLEGAKISRSLVYKKHFTLIWQVVFKLGYLFSQER